MAMAHHASFVCRLGTRSRSYRQFWRNLFPSGVCTETRRCVDFQRTISTTSLRSFCDKYREVLENTSGETTVVEASYRAPDDNFKAIDDHHGACPICSRNLQVTYKDVLILNQFVDSEGNILPRDLTGVCAKQQVNLQTCIERALAAGLLPDHIPAHLKKPSKEKGKAAFHRF